MSALNRLSIEYPTMSCHTSIPIPTPAQAPPSVSEHVTEREPRFSNMWKRICDFFTRSLKSRKRKALEEKNRILEEKNQKLEEGNQILEDKSKMMEEEAIMMKVKLEEVFAMGKRTKGWLENEVDRGTKGIKAMLQLQIDELHEKRVSELQVFREMFQRHEEVAHGFLSYKQGYEDIIEECDSAQQRIRYLTDRNERLVLLTNELEGFLAEEREKVAMYERTWHEVGGRSSNQQNSVSGGHFQ